MTLPRRPLEGCVVGLSISESDDNLQLGFPSWQVNRATLQIVAALFGQGASVVFAHDWREDGVMEAVYGFARQIQPPLPMSPDDAAAKRQPVLRNLIPWPESPRLPEHDLDMLSSTLRVEPAGLPSELRAVDEEARRAAPDGPIYRYLRARGLTFLRHRLNDTCHVRLCIGGRRAGFVGRYPGVAEEAMIALQDGKPLYLASFLGGATKQIVDAIEGKKMADEFCNPLPLKDLYEHPPVSEQDEGTRNDRVIDRVAIWSSFAEVGREKLAAVNRLTVAENDELHHTPIIDRTIELVLNGISRRWRDLTSRTDS